MVEEFKPGITEVDDGVYYIKIVDSVPAAGTIVREEYFKTGPRRWRRVWYAAGEFRLENCIEQRYQVVRRERVAVSEPHFYDPASYTVRTKIIRYYRVGSRR